MGITAGLPLNWPAAADTLLIKFHFILPVILAALAQMIFSLVEEFYAEQSNISIRF